MEHVTSTGVTMNLPVQGGKGWEGLQGGEPQRAAATTPRGGSEWACERRKRGGGGVVFLQCGKIVGPEENSSMYMELL